MSNNSRVTVEAVLEEVKNHYRHATLTQAEAEELRISFGLPPRPQAVAPNVVNFMAIRNQLKPSQLH